MKLIDFIDTANPSQKIKAKVKIYGMYAEFVGCKKDFKKADKELLNKEVAAIYEGIGYLVVRLAEA